MAIGAWLAMHWGSVLGYIGLIVSLILVLAEAGRLMVASLRQGMVSRTRPQLGRKQHPQHSS